MWQGLWKPFADILKCLVEVTSVQEVLAFLGLFRVDVGALVRPDISVWWASVLWAACSYFPLGWSWGRSLYVASAVFIVSPPPPAVTTCLVRPGGLSQADPDAVSLWQNANSQEWAWGVLSPTLQLLETWPLVQVASRWHRHLRSPSRCSSSLSGLLGNPIGRATVQLPCKLLWVKSIVINHFSTAAGTMWATWWPSGVLPLTTGLLSNLLSAEALAVSSSECGSVLPAHACPLPRALWS